MDYGTAEPGCDGTMGPRSIKALHGTNVQRGLVFMAIMTAQ